MYFPKETTDLYTVVNNTFIYKDTGELNSKFELEIGDILSNKFQPQLKIMRWDNECNFSVRLIDNDIDTPLLETEGNKIIFIKEKVEAHFYNIPKTKDMPDCYEFEIILKERPKTNKIQMSIETKGLKFYYQPELTQEEKDEGAFRPENVIGSYAVYHENKAGDYHLIGGKNYMAGKAFHIYRPKIIDSVGTEVRGKLNITDNLLTVEISQEFLDSAVYPVRHAAGLTFGYESAGGSSYNVGNCICMAGASFIYTATTGDTISSFHLYGSGSGKTMGVAAYSISATPQNRLASPVTINLGDSAAWCIASGLSQSMSNGVSYGAAFGQRSASAVAIHYDSGTGNNRSSDSRLPLSAVWEHSNWSSSRWSIYCTYTAGAGVSPTGVFYGPLVGPFGGPT